VKGLLNKIVWKDKQIACVEDVVKWETKK